MRGAVTLTLLLLSAPLPAHAFCRMTTVASDPNGLGCTSEGVPLSWRRPCIEYAVDMRGSVDVDLETLEQTLAASFATWQAASCDSGPIGFEFRAASELAACREAAFDSEGGNVNVVAFVPDLDEGPVLALTTVWYSTRTGEIFDADILVNETQGPFGVCPPEGCAGSERPHDLQNLFTHEIGHFLGLAHSADSKATMFATSIPGEVRKRSLSPDDQSGICAIYEEAPLPSQCDFRPRGGRDLSCEDPASGCGCAVAPRSAAPAPWPLFGLVLVSMLTTLLRRVRIHSAP